MLRYLKTFEGYLPKEAYDRKREWAAKRMAKNKEIDTLTEEQHDVLADLCEIRHEFHTNMDDITKHDTSKIKQELVRINMKINEAGLKPMEFIPYGDISDYIDIDTIDELYEIEEVPEYNSERQDWYDDNYYRIFKELGELHEKIEDYLRNIDKKYGTDYCPSGASRIF